MKKLKNYLRSDDPQVIEMGVKTLASEASLQDLDIVLSYVTHPSPLIQRKRRASST